MRRRRGAVRRYAAPCRAMPRYDRPTGAHLLYHLAVPPFAVPPSFPVTLPCHLPCNVAVPPPLSRCRATSPVTLHACCPARRPTGTRNRQTLTRAPYGRSTTLRSLPPSRPAWLPSCAHTTRSTARTRAATNRSAAHAVRACATTKHIPVHHPCAPSLCTIPRYAISRYRLSMQFLLSTQFLNTILRSRADPGSRAYQV
jgi:hypothetical protein